MSRLVLLGVGLLSGACLGRGDATDIDRRINELLHQVIALFEQRRRVDAPNDLSPIAAPTPVPSPSGETFASTFDLKGPKPPDRREPSISRPQVTTRVVELDKNGKEVPRSADHPKRTNLSGEKGNPSFVLGIVGSQFCQATFVGNCTLASAAHCASGLRKDQNPPQLKFEGELQARQFGVTGKEGQNNTVLPKVRATFYVSPEYKAEYKDIIHEGKNLGRGSVHPRGVPNHDFLVMQIHQDDCRKLRLPKQIVPMCRRDDIKPNQRVWAASHRTGGIYEGFVVEEKKVTGGQREPIAYPWKELEKHTVPIELLTREKEQGVMGGDSGGGAFGWCGSRGKMGLIGTLSTCYGGCGEIQTGQHAGYSYPDTWAHELVEALTRGDRPNDLASTTYPHRSHRRGESHDGRFPR